MSNNWSGNEDTNAPPPSSQSHFTKFENFTPDNDAPFEDEFARLASSQDWVPGSQEYIRERTIAMREEIKFHYFDEPLDTIEEEISDEERKLRGFQSLCREVRISPGDSIEQCQKDLKNTWVNIVDLIDTRRTKKRVKVWDDFEAFRKYTLKKPINLGQAKKEGYLASLLQRVRSPRLRRRRANGGRRDLGDGVVSGRIVKQSAEPTIKILPR